MFAKKRRAHTPSHAHELESLFSLPSNEARALARLATPLSLPAGTTLARQGGMDHQLVLICAGDVTVERSGTEIARLGAGDVVGEMSLLDYRTYQSATVRTAAPSRVAVLGRREFATLADQVPTLHTRLCDLVAARASSVSA